MTGFCNFFMNYLDKPDTWKTVLAEMNPKISETHAYLSAHMGATNVHISGKYVACSDGINPESIIGKPIETLSGAFAFAIWDNEKLVLCRDRVGIKPLFYTFKNDTLIFGSQPKELFAHPDVTPEIDTNSLREIFGLGPAHTPGNGVFKNIREVLPGHYMVFSKNGLESVKYWALQSLPHEDNFEETLEKTAFLVTDAIKRHTTPDTCSLLSGGIDSSIVTAVASKYHPALSTFSFDFTGNDEHFSANSFQPERDRPFVDKFLGKYPLNHTYLECNETDLADLLYTAVDSKDLPGMTDIDASLLYFCSRVKESHPIALTGECADEIFGGYPWFYREDLMNAGTFPWSTSRDLLLSQEFLSELNLGEYVQSRYHNSLCETPKLSGEPPLEARRREINYLTIYWFMQTLLTRMDRASRYSGLSACVPFADHKIIEYLWNVPWEMKCHGNIIKGLLRESFCDLLPHELLNRKKSPFPKTYNPNYTRILAERLTEVINDPTSPILPMIDKKKTEDFIKSPVEYGKPWFGQLMSDTQVMAYLLQVNYWLGKYR